MSDFIGVKVSVWRWAWTQMRRDWRSGSMRFPARVGGLAVTALSAVAFFADRIEAGLARRGPVDWWRRRGGGRPTRA